MGTGSGTKKRRLRQGFERGKDGRNVAVEGKGFAMSVGRFYAARMHFQGWSNMGIYPEGPESVIEVKDYHTGQRKAFSECLGRKYLFDRVVYMIRLGILT